MKLVAGVLTCVFAVLVAASPASAVQFVTSSEDSGPGSLREAVAAASPGELVLIEDGVAPVLANQIEIDKDLTIKGQGAAETTIDGNDVTRVFEVGSAEPEIEVVFQALTITGGRAPDGAPGAAAGTEPIEPAEPGQPGEGGGAIRSAAEVLELLDVVLEGNRAGNGGIGGSDFEGGQPGAGGSGGGGGAVVHDGGLLLLLRSSLIGNRAGDGGAPGAATFTVASGGVGGDGGAIAGEGFVSIVESTFVENLAGQGAAGIGGPFGSLPPQPGGGGGAVLSDGEITVERSTFAGNLAGAGGSGSSGGFGIQSGAAGGPGGALLLRGGENGIVNSTFESNAGGPGGTGSFAFTGSGGAGGPGGDGGAIATEGGLLLIAASTLAANGGGAGGSGGESIISPGALGPSGAAGSGGAYAGTAEPIVRGSIFAANTGAPEESAACDGFVQDDGGNIAFPAVGGCPAEFAVADPKLDPAGLADNGGPTETIALLAGSAAIDASPPGSCTDIQAEPLTTDQRGVTRPEGACDSGAFEYVAPPEPEPEPEPQPEPQPQPQPTPTPAATPHAAAPPQASSGRPDTTWKRKPKKLVRTRRARANVKIAFTSKPAGAEFQCKLDRGRFKRCKSPLKLRLKPGRHVIRVRAVQDGAVDKTPLKAVVRVIRLKPKR